jgi:hypothetical protein
VRYQHMGDVLVLQFEEVFDIFCTIVWYVLDRWFTERTDHIVNTFGPKGFSSSSILHLSRQNTSNSLTVTIKINTLALWQIVRR